MTIIKNIPIDIFNGMSSINKSILIPKYHKLCTEKYDWLVRDHNNNTTYYIKGDLPDLIDGICVYDCNWNPDDWDNKPYKYYKKPFTNIIVNHYARYGLPTLNEYDYGYTREDCLVTENNTAVFYAIQSNVTGDYAYWDIKKNTLTMNISGYYVDYYNGVFNEGCSFSSKKDVKHGNSELVLKLCKKINNRKFKNLYQPFIEKLIEVYKINKSQI